MEILVCIKQVPDDSVEISMNANTGKPALEGVAEVVNAFDTYALEMATRLKELKRGNICVLSLSGENVTNSLKNCLAVGADEAFYIKNENYQNIETIHVAKILKEGINKIEEQRGKKFDIIFCGKESTDFSSGQVGIMLGNYLKYGVITNLVDINVLEENKVIAKRETEEGYQKIETEFPCLVTVTKPSYEPRYPTIKSKMLARKKEILEIKIDFNEKNIIENLKEFAPPKRQAGVKLKTGSPEELVKQAIEKILEAKIL
ncbi:MAG: electron transfer flavoprotein subunit beta/FixA family protein [Fusobacterium sp.]|uniref:electron transfer flavoprotein subunit beta/FixA family protein n=1 Tax=Fusobacterium sp. TaxID=68766 RepID=UPI0026DD579D|nr:electron transfer flavoprotein subunit beta/FixA family protein [Fusobacterium sp.]MDO4690171.1 electron transfer flavoprotein subunit beta/FixA family protein [Fusobacterium sp.]